MTSQGKCSIAWRNGKSLRYKTTYWSVFKNMYNRTTGEPNHEKEIHRRIRMGKSALEGTVNYFVRNSTTVIKAKSTYRDKILY